MIVLINYSAHHSCFDSIYSSFERGHRVILLYIYFTSKLASFIFEIWANQILNNVSMAWWTYVNAQSFHVFHLPSQCYHLKIWLGSTESLQGFQSIGHSDWIIFYKNQSGIFVAGWFAEGTWIASFFGLLSLGSALGWGQWFHLCIQNWIFVVDRVSACQV
jgi:hypothetical protein